MSNEVLMCDMVPGQPAQMRYRWPWDPPGEWKACSSTGQRLLRQKAAHLKRTVEFLPLVAETDPAARPLERSERQQLHAAKLAAEDELKDAQARSTRLYQQTVELTADLKQAKREAEQLAAVAKSKTEDLERSVQERARLSAQVGQLTAEIAKANRLLESENGAVGEVASLKSQLDTAQLHYQKLEKESAAAAERGFLRISELERELAACRDGR